MFSMVSISEVITRSQCDTWRFKGEVSDGHLKHFRKPRDDPILNLAHVNLAAEQVFHGSHLLAVAGDDQIKETKIRIHVKRKAVRRHPTRNVYANGCYFSSRCVHASQSFDSKSRNLKICQRAN